MCDFEKYLKRCQWLDYEKSNKKRLGYGAVFLAIGIVLICIAVHKFHIIDKMLKYYLELLWVAGWSSAGIGAGLINRRIKEKEETRDKQHCHFIIYYFIFAFFVSGLAGFALGGYENGALNFSLSALISLTIGFSAKKLNELAPIK